MAVAEDLKKLVDTWNDLGPLSKVLGVGTVFLSALSVASIADATFKFKGFILTGIEFYNSITEPLRIMLSDLLWFEIPETYFQMLILGLVGLSATFHASKNNNLKVQIKSLLSTLLIIIAMFTGTIALAGKIPKSYALMFAFSFPIALWTITFDDAAAEVPLSPNLSEWKDKFQEARELRTQGNKRIRTLAAVYVVASYLLVCIIAGISEGIARTG